MTGTGWLIRGRVEKIPPELEVGWEGVGGKTPSFQFISTWWDLTLALLFCTQFWSQVSDVLWPYVQGRENMLICFFFYQPMIALRNPNGNFDTYLFHILHHTGFGYQKLTFSFLLQRLQIWYFMVIYRYLIERDISIDKYDLFPDIGFSQGISGVANSQFFTLFNGENTKWVYYRYLYAPICQGLLSGLFRIQFCDFAIANLN